MNMNADITRIIFLVPSIALLIIMIRNTTRNKMNRRKNRIGLFLIDLNFELFSIFSIVWFYFGTGVTTKGTDIISIIGCIILNYMPLITQIIVIIVEIHTSSNTYH